MKPVKRILLYLTSAALLAGLAINFNACTEQTPLSSDDNETNVSITALGNKGGQGGSKKPGTQEAPYPQYDSQLIRFHAPTNHYRGGNLDLPNGASFNIQGGALIPPPEIPWGEEVTITMLCEKDSVKNELIFTFGPSGCQFGSGARIFLDYRDLGMDRALLYYIDENGNYILQSPDYIDYEQKRMTIYISHFSRYAIGAE